MSEDGAEISMTLGNTVSLRITGGAEDDLNDVADAMTGQLEDALSGATEIRDLKKSLDDDNDNHNDQGVR